MINNLLKETRAKLEKLEERRKLIKEKKTEQQMEKTRLENNRQVENIEKKDNKKRTWSELTNTHHQQYTLKRTKTSNESLEIELNERGEYKIETHESTRRLRNTVNNRMDEVITHLE